MGYTSHHSFQHPDGTIDMQHAVQVRHNVKAAATRRVVGIGSAIFRVSTGPSKTLLGFPIVAIALIIGATSFLSACSTTGPITSSKSSPHPMSGFSVRGDF